MAKIPQNWCVEVISYALILSFFKHTSMRINSLDLTVCMFITAGTDILES